MELCIKTNIRIFGEIQSPSFNPCFNGTMYKNFDFLLDKSGKSVVSILVLMELCIKTDELAINTIFSIIVSILVLMELCIKTLFQATDYNRRKCFNPCFNGTMYKNSLILN